MNIDAAPAGVLQWSIDAYAKKYPGLEFSWYIACKGGYGNPPFEFQLKVLIKEQNRHNIFCTLLESEKERFEWGAIESMIDAGAAWAEEMRRKWNTRGEPMKKMSAWTGRENYGADIVLVIRRESGEPGFEDRLFSHFKTVEKHLPVEGEQVLHLTDEAAQQLVNSLWEQGFRPSWSKIPAILDRLGAIEQKLLDLPAVAVVGVAP